MIEIIDLEHIRLFVRSCLKPSSRMTILLGANGTGKTSVLEAVQVLATTKSFRTSRLRDLISDHCDYGKISAHAFGHTLSLTLGPRSKKLVLDGQAKSKLNDFCSVFASVSLVPEHHAMIQGSSSERRKYLDQILLAQDPSYLHHLRRYEKALEHKRALLSNALSFTHYQHQVSVWNATLIAEGDHLRSRRTALLKALQEPCARFYQELAQSDARFTLTYQQNEQALAEQLKVMAHAEHAAQRCLCGPHRDDLLLHLGGQEAQSHASQGERSSMLLALKFAELAIIRGSQEHVVLLLDDVGGTLDPLRREKLFAWLKDQPYPSLISTSDPHLAALCAAAGGKIYSPHTQEQHGIKYTQWLAKA